MDIERRLSSRAEIRKQVREQIVEFKGAACRLGALTAISVEPDAGGGEMSTDEHSLQRLRDDIGAVSDAHTAAAAEIATVEELISTTESNIVDVKAEITQRLQLQDRLEQLVKRRDELIQRERSFRRIAGGFVIVGLVVIALLFWIVWN